MHPLLNVAVMAARDGGNTLIRSLKKLDREHLLALSIEIVAATGVQAAWQP